MSSVAPNDSRISRVSQALSGLFSYFRRNFRTAAKVVALIAIIVELGAIWNEVHQMRSEQVKNITYALPQRQRDAIKETFASKRMQSTAFVNGNVTIDGRVDLNEPVQVEIDR